MLQRGVVHADPLFGVGVIDSTAFGLGPPDLCNREANETFGPVKAGRGSSESDVPAMKGPGTRRRHKQIPYRLAAGTFSSARSWSSAAAACARPIVSTPATQSPPTGPALPTRQWWFRPA